MPFFAHPDIFWINAGPYHLSDGCWNIYSVHGDKSNIHLFKYPPLAYYLLGLNITIVKPLIHSPDFFANLSDIHSYPNWFAKPGIFQSLFFLKLIYLIFDILLIYLIARLFAGYYQSALIKFWAFSPLIIYSTYMYGQFDIIPVFFIVSALFFFKNENYDLSIAMLSIAGMLKHFPFLLLPFFLIFTPARLVVKPRLIAIAIIPYILLSTPFLTTRSFYSDVLLNSSEYLRGANAFIIIYSLLIISAFIFGRNHNNKFRLLVSFSFLTLSAYLIAAQFHPQFIIWICPFLLIFLTEYKNYSGFYIALIILYFIFINELGRNSTVLLLLPLDNELALLPSINSIVEKYINFESIIQLTRYLMGVIFIIYFILYLGNKKNECK